MENRISQYLRSNVLGLVAIFIALGGVSWAATTVKKNTVVSKSIKNGQVKNADLAANSVDGAKVQDGGLSGSDLAPNSVGGDQVDEATLGQVPSAQSAGDANSLDGADSSAFQKRVTGTCASGSAIREVAEDGNVTCENGALGDITAVNAGSGLTGGGSSGDVSLALGPIGSAEVTNNSLTGDDVNESSFGIVPNADQLDGISSAGFIQNGTAAQSAGFHVTQNSRVQGLLRQGNETGTAQPPIPNGGVITRRINDVFGGSAGSVVARTDSMRLERNGTTGGLQMSWDDVPQVRNFACSGTTAAGAPANVYQSVPANSAGVAGVFSDAQNVVQVNCHFGFPYDLGHTTSVDMIRRDGDNFWAGFLTSTFNQ